MSPSRPYGIIAEFGTDDALLDALRAARQAGWQRMEAFSPYPIAEAAALLGATGARVAWISIGAGLCGAVIAYGLQWWLSVQVYPINVGGRPLHAWPAFLPATTIVAILWAAAAALIGMLALNRLPRLSHPVFDAPGFDRASQDRFFLLIRADDPGFGTGAPARFLRGLHPLRVAEVPGE